MYSCNSLGDGSRISRAVCLCHQPEMLAATRRIGTELTRRGFVAGMAASLAMLGLPARSFAQVAPPPARPIWFSNFRLFDSRAGRLRDGLCLLVDGNLIKAVTSGNPTPPDGAQQIDCGGRVLMPGLIDAHWHTFFAGLPIQSLLAGDVGYIHLAAAAESERTLMRGFTTVRDLGGPVFAFKQAVDEGLVVGPRIYPCGAMITASGGHGDLRSLSDLPRQPGNPNNFVERSGAAAIVDSPDEIRLRAREQLMQGASQLKVVGGGGVSSPRSPLDLTTLSEAEVRSAVDVANDWNTYVAVHAYAPKTVQRAVNAGVRCIEHAHLMDEPTAALMADKGVWLSIQPFLSEEDTGRLAGPSWVAALQVFGGTDNAYQLARKHKLKTAFGSDMLFNRDLAARQGVMLNHLSRWYSNAEILTMATATNADLMAMSGPRNPYPGKLGVLETGALADLLLVDGNPLDDLSLLAKPESSLLIVMKDGKIHKNTLKT